MEQKILSELGDYLLARREEIVGEWILAVEQNPNITSLDHLKDEKERANHLPQLCQNLAELLKSPQSDQDRAQVSRAARVHGSIAGGKVTGLRKSFARRASSEELFPIIG